MNFWYDQNVTIQSLQTMGQLDNVFQTIFNSINNIKEDFEIKRMIIGLSTLTLSQNSSSLDAGVQTRFGEFMKAIVFLCQKSLEIREKKFKPIEEASVDKDCENGAIYDEDEDDGELRFDNVDSDSDEDEWSGGESDDENDLYDSNLDKIDEILHVK